MSVKKLSPQNGGFIRAKLARPRTFCAKANGNFEENPKWRIDMGKIFCQIGPLSRDRARILYLIILWMKHAERPIRSGVLLNRCVL